MSNRGFITKRDERQVAIYLSEASAGRKPVLGFTLVETIVAIAATTFMFIVLNAMLTYFYKTNEYTLEQAQSVQQSRRGIQSAMRDLREASYGSDGSYPVTSAATSSITFYSNVNSDVNIEQVRYFVQSGTLYRTVVTPAGNPPSYAGQAIATTTIATSVVNATSTPVFRYFDDTGAELTGTVNISQIASVTTTVVVDVNVNRAPIAFTLSGGATLRNLKEQR